MRTAEDLVALVPYLLGYHPADSLTVLGLGEREGRTRVRFCLRMDIPPADARSDVVTGIADGLGTAAERNQAAAVALVAYSASAAATARLAREVTQDLDARRIPVRDGIRADGERWWAATDGEGRAEAGTPYDVDAHPLVSSAIYHGMVALPDERALRASIAPAVGEELQRARAATARARTEFAVRHPGADTWPTGERAGLRPVVEAGERYVGDLLHRWMGDEDGQSPSDSEIAWLCLYLSHPRVRDAVWSLMDRATAEWHLRVWQHVACRCDPDLRATPFLLLGFAAWLNGNGVLARLAVETALTADPACSAARLVAQLLATATPPSRWTPPANRAA